jgi:glycine cleavage system H lipoate-binding protein
MKLSVKLTSRWATLKVWPPEMREVVKMKAKDKHKETEKKRLVGFRVEVDECIWMKAGVVNFRLCDNVFDCYQCPFDTGMQRAMTSGKHSEIELKEPEWAKYLKMRYHGPERPCRHTLTGRTDAPKICTMNYECYHCAFDQMMDEIDTAELGEPPDYALASGYKVAEGYYYHPGHCWVRFEHGGRVRIGFDDFMVKLFGESQFLALPPIGTSLEKNHIGLFFGRDKKKAGALSPVTGTVLKLNPTVHDNPKISLEDPYHKGWLYVLEPDMPKKNLKGLYYGKESMRWIEQEARKLMNLMGPEYEQLASTGAQPISDVFGNFPELGWDLLVKTFLRIKT